MGVLDKIKNALFEVEYVEVEDTPKKEKKHKSKETEKEDVSVEKPIAKKIVLPGKKEEKVEQLEEEELRDEDFEIRPKNEMVKEVFRDNFNVMDDDDLIPETPEPEPVREEPAVPVVEDIPTPAYIPEEPTVPPTEPTTPATTPVYREPTYADKDYVREYDSYREKVHNTVEADYRTKPRESRPYGMDPSYQVSIKAYGTENKDDKTYFKPSPIISPIYGILDKNYKKEDVVSKKEIRITSNYTRTNVNVDDIRNKAYGKRSNEEFNESPVIETTPASVPRSAPPFEVEPEEEENLLVDLSDEKKPEVKEITMGDAMEYFQDLGLEYNVDYVDASSKNPPKQPADDLEEDIKDTMNSTEEEKVPETQAETVPQAIPEMVPETQPETQPETKPEVVVKKEEAPVEEPEKKETPVVETKDETKEESGSTLDDDDNLFDLIDSMYREEDN